MDISAWLRELGLERYEQAFQEGEIDLEVLADLTDADLRELGIPLGPRKKLLKAISALAARTELASARGARRPEAERRQLTVMFVDLVGSTELSGRLDPEDMGHVIRAYQECCAKVVARWGGYIAKYMGDGMLAYFGYPRAHEDDAERAVRAGLELVAAVARLEAGYGTPLSARVGIATGLVMVGDLIGEEEAQERAVVGETPNLAARLQALADPGQVVISGRTRRLVGGLFEVKDLGEQRLKGFAEAQRACRVIGASAAESRFEALHGERLTPLVGREQEIALLLDRWMLARGGEGQVVLLSGEAGIGKSRITRALLERQGDESYARLRYYCSPYHINSALHPVIEQLERAAGFQADDGADAKLDKLDAVLGRAGDRVAETASLLAALCSLAIGERYPPLNLTPLAQKTRTLDALVRQIEDLAAHQPVLMILEDAHWIDPTTTELFELVIGRIQHLPVLLLITFRPEFTPPWAGHAHATTFTLNRLGRKQGAAIVERLTGGKTLPAEVLDQILAKTDGVPLFVEELTQTVLESGLLEEHDDRFVLTDPLPSLAIPSTLHDSLMARLDRLAPVKEVAQTGAVIGREFSHELLAAVVPMGDNDLRDALGQLVNAELIFRRGTAPDATYTFKHALVQDAAYQSLLKSRRQQLHARIAQVLEQHFADTVPEVLGYHFTEAKLYDRAIYYWLRAGARQIESSMYREAFTNLQKGLTVIADHRKEGQEWLAEELEMQMNYGISCQATMGHTNENAETAFRRVLHINRIMGSDRILIPAFSGLWTYYLNTGMLDRAYDLSREFLEVAEDRNDDVALVVARRLLGNVLFHMGNQISANEQFNRVIDECGADLRRALLGASAYDPLVGVLSFSAFSAWLLGYPESAQELAQRALSRAQEISHPYTFAFVYTAASIHHILRLEFDRAVATAEKTISLSEEQRYPYFVNLSRSCRGWALARGGDLQRGQDEMCGALQEGRSLPWRPFMLCGLADVLASRGESDEALEALARAEEIIEATGARWWEAEILRSKGRVELVGAEKRSTSAEEYFQTALAIAQKQSVKSLELRAAVSLARLWRDQGKHREARGLLVPIYDWFTEGFDTTDLKDARVLLDQLC